MTRDTQLKVIEIINSVTEILNINIRNSGTANLYYFKLLPREHMHALSARLAIECLAFRLSLLGKELKPAETVKDLG